MAPEWTSRVTVAQLFLPHASQGPWNNVSLHRLPTQLLRSSEIRYFSGRTPSPEPDQPGSWSRGSRRKEGVPERKIMKKKSPNVHIWEFPGYIFLAIFLRWMRKEHTQKSLKCFEKSIQKHCS